MKMKFFQAKGEYGQDSTFAYWEIEKDYMLLIFNSESYYIF